MILQVKTQRKDPSVVVPARAHKTDAAFDLYSNERVDIAPGDRALVGTGVYVAIPEGYCGLVLARSGRALKDGLTVLNAPGLIDSGYRGEIKVLLAHLGLRTERYTAGERPHSHEQFCEGYINIFKGDRIAQLMIVKARDAAFVGAVELDDSDRGDNGFGSTGQ